MYLIEGHSTSFDRQQDAFATFVDSANSPGLNPIEFLHLSYCVTVVAGLEMKKKKSLEMAFRGCQRFFICCMYLDLSVILGIKISWPTMPIRIHKRVRTKRICVVGYPFPQHTNQYSMIFHD